MSRIFTPEEANEALAEVRPLVEQMVATRQAHREAEQRHAELAARAAGNGQTSSDLRSTTAAAGALAEQLGAIVAEIQELGVLVKDLDTGLVDFPARRGEDVVLLCWRLGEDEVRYWHGLEEGFAGRKPL